MNGTSPEEEVFLYWFACRVMGLAIKVGRQNMVMRELRRIYRVIGRKYIDHNRLEMAEDIKALGERLIKRMSEQKKEFDL